MSRQFQSLLSRIRQAEAGKIRITVDQAYVLFEETLKDLRELKVLSFTQEAERLLHEWRQKKVRDPHTICE